MPTRTRDAKTLAEELASHWRWDEVPQRSVTVPRKLLEEIVKALREADSAGEARLVPTTWQERDPETDARALAHQLAEERGHVVVTWDKGGRQILAVTRQTVDGQIIAVLAEAPQDGEDMPHA